jgi:hypothetical protein
VLPVCRRDLKIGGSQQCRFHGPEITKSGVACPRVFSTPVNGYALASIETVVGRPTRNVLSPKTGRHTSWMHRYDRIA